LFAEDPLESDRPFMEQNKKAKENQTYLPELTENFPRGITRNTVLAPTVVQMPLEEKAFSEEVEL
ncbi:hypothetical protein N303_08479, partial [Cuculus canorus]